MISEIADTVQYLVTVKYIEQVCPRREHINKVHVPRRELYTSAFQYKLPYCIVQAKSNNLHNYLSTRVLLPTTQTELRHFRSLPTQFMVTTTSLFTKSASTLRRSLKIKKAILDEPMHTKTSRAPMTKT